MTLALAPLLTGCGGDRASGAGDLSVTSRASTVTIRTADTRGRRTSRSRGRGAAADSTISFTSVPLRGTSHRLTVPRGWSAELWAHITGARLEAWTPGSDSKLLVSSPDSGTITELSPENGRLPSSRVVATGLTNPQGIAFDDLDGHEYVYVADSDAVVRFVLSSGGGLSGRRTLIANLPDTLPAGNDVHRLKNLVVAPDHNLFVDIGSSSNATPPAATPRGTLPRASVVEFSPAGRFIRVWATGVRNGDGLAFAPNGTLWTAVNERDQITFPFHRAYASTGNAYGQIIPAYVDNHPPDEIAELTPGRDLGWPYCDPNPDDQPGGDTTALHYENLGFVADQQTNPNDRRLNCAKLAPLQLGLPAHSAPLGLSFLTRSRLPQPWSDGAVVAGHGSWDRQPPRPPVIYWMPWNARTQTLGTAIVLVSGFQYANGSRWGRTVDAVPGPDGSLYVTDDQAGAVYRITP